MATKQVISPDAIPILPRNVVVETNLVKFSTKSKKFVQGNSKAGVGPEGTVVLRQALPKYSFQLRNKTKCSCDNIAGTELGKKDSNFTDSLQDGMNVSSSDGHKADFSQESSTEQSLVRFGTSQTLTALLNGEKPVKRVDPFQTSTVVDHISPSSLVNLPTALLPLDPTVFSSISWPRSQEVELLKEENVSLQSQLDVQLKVNAELKKMLVASVGEDLHCRVENLARDRAELTNEVRDYIHRMTEGSEHIDRVSIQADMWRSKFLGSRMMADELARANAFYSLQYQESQNALQQLLNERHELQTNLMESYRDLLTVKSAFDPLNTQKSVGIASANNIDLVKANRLLSETIKFRLLPSNISLHLGINTASGWGSDFTKAEAYANELISKQVREPDFPQSSLMPPTAMTVDRFHPCTRYDNLTFNCCNRCNGEIIVV